MMTAFIGVGPYPTLLQRTPGHGDVGDCCVPGEDQGRDGAAPGQNLATWCQDRSGAWPARKNGKANIRPKVPALPTQVTSMRRAPMAARTTAAPATRTSRRRGWPTDPRRDGAVDEDGGDDGDPSRMRSAVGSRTLPDRRHLVEVAGDVAVDPVGGTPGHPGGRPRPPARGDRTAARGRQGRRAGARPRRRWGSSGCDPRPPSGWWAPKAPLTRC